VLYDEDVQLASGPDMLFCPGDDYYKAKRSNYEPWPTGVAWPGGSERIVTSYSFSPYLYPYEPAGGPAYGSTKEEGKNRTYTNWEPRSYWKYHEMDGSKVLLMDRLWSPAHEASEGWNVASPDGVVQFRTSAVASQAVEQFGSSLGHWDHYEELHDSLWDLEQ
jgi:hypothetical protein